MKVGIITYHAAYNFGSMLQAYATQEAVKKIGHEAIMLNYRMPSQKNFYKEYRTGYGKLNFVQDLLQFPMHKDKIARREKFEIFLKEYFNLSAEFNEPEEMRAICEGLDVIISGSDQIWNAKSCEFVKCDMRYMRPYLLDGFEGKKISYASSIGHMGESELEKIISFISDFDFLSVREQAAKTIIERYIDIPIDRVLDPTFLLNRNEWINKLKLKREDENPYILFYSLKRFDGNVLLKEVKECAKKRNLAVKYIMPFSYLPNMSKNVKNCENYGPVEFMNAIYNSKMVITDSYHGTILSLNLNKNVYSLCNNAGAEFRKTEVLERLGLGTRIIGGVNEAFNVTSEIDFDAINEVIIEEREKSFNYLLQAIGR